jgi:hypothetical protein
MEDTPMKKFGTCITFALVALAFASFHPMHAYADTVTLTLENVGPGNNSGGVYTYPYNFSVDGTKPYVSLMCFAYEQEIYVGETWTATVESVTSASPDDYKELAYLYNVAADPTSSATTVSAAQWAAWELFDPSLTNSPNPPGQEAVDAELTLAASFIESADPSYYSNIALYIPVAGSQIPNTDGLPQSFIGDPPVPEPSGLVLLGSGLLLSALLLFRKQGTASSVRL